MSVRCTGGPRSDLRASWATGNGRCEVMLIVQLDEPDESGATKGVVAGLNDRLTLWKQGQRLQYAPDRSEGSVHPPRTNGPGVATPWRSKAG